MDIIEKAAKRLEELRRAGLEVPGDDSAPAAHREEPAVAAAPQPTSRAALAGTDAPAAAPSPGEMPAEAIERRHHSRNIEIDMDDLAARGFVTPHGSRTELADQIRVVKRPLLHNVSGKGAAPVKDANLIMITSALPGEGKTHTSVNLAMSIAMELDHTVLLVDADVARPSVPGALGIGHGRGLLDLLVDNTLELNQVLLRTNVEKLSLLQAGTQHPRATELLASDAMNNLLADMARRYADRIIIFDSPPLLVTTEARALATHMGQVVLVVKAESTSHADIKNAVATIAACPVKMTILNQTTHGYGAAYGGYGYGGYGYGYGYGYGHRGKSASAAQAEGRK